MHLPARTANLLSSIPNAIIVAGLAATTTDVDHDGHLNLALAILAGYLIWDWIRFSHKAIMHVHHAVGLILIGIASSMGTVVSAPPMFLEIVRTLLQMEWCNPLNQLILFLNNFDTLKQKRQGLFLVQRLLQVANVIVWFRYRIWGPLGAWFAWLTWTVTIDDWSSCWIGVPLLSIVVVLQIYWFVALLRAAFYIET
jgi:hypothetical protein